MTDDCFDTFSIFKEDTVNKIDDNKILHINSDNNFFTLMKYNNTIIKTVVDIKQLDRFFGYLSVNKIDTKRKYAIRSLRSDESILNAHKIFLKNIDLYNIGKEYKIIEPEIFYIITMRTNYNILKKLFLNNIPEVKFAIVESKYFGTKYSIIQKYIEGISLWDLYNNMDTDFIERRPFIKKELRKFINCKHIDFNIKNFIITEYNNIFYIDNKPTFLSEKLTNNKNIKAIKKYIL